MVRPLGMVVYNQLKLQYIMFLWQHDLSNENISSPELVWYCYDTKRGAICRSKDLFYTFKWNGL